MWIRDVSPKHFLDRQRLRKSQDQFTFAPEPLFVNGRDGALLKILADWFTSLRTFWCRAARVILKSKCYRFGRPVCAIFQAVRCSAAMTSRRFCAEILSFWFNTFTMQQCTVMRMDMLLRLRFTTYLTSKTSTATNETRVHLFTSLIKADVQHVELQLHCYVCCKDEMWNWHVW